MKKLLLLALAIVAVFSLAACKEKKQEEAAPVESAPVVEEEAPVVEEEAPVEEEQVGVGNTDESMVVLALEQYFNEAFSGEVEEINFVNVKVYSEEEIEANEALKSHELKEGDIPFEVDYELKIKEGVEDLMKYTAATGTIDGQWIKDKSNLGIARNTEEGYKIDAFGTGW